MRGWTRGLPTLGAPGAQQCATLVLFPRTENFDGLDSMEQLLKSQFVSRVSALCMFSQHDSVAAYLMVSVDISDDLQRASSYFALGKIHESFVVTF